MSWLKEKVIFQKLFILFVWVFLYCLKNRMSPTSINSFNQGMNCEVSAFKRLMHMLKRKCFCLERKCRCISVFNSLCCFLTPSCGFIWTMTTKLDATISTSCCFSIHWHWTESFTSIHIHTSSMMLQSAPQVTELISMRMLQILTCATAVYGVTIGNNYTALLSN